MNPFHVLSLWTLGNIILPLLLDQPQFIIDNFCSVKGRLLSAAAKDKAVLQVKKMVDKGSSSEDSEDVLDTPPAKKRKDELPPKNDSL
jgi:hypothetical protein